MLVDLHLGYRRALWAEDIKDMVLITELHTVSASISCSLSLSKGSMEVNCLFQAGVSPG